MSAWRLASAGLFLTCVMAACDVGPPVAGGPSPNPSSPAASRGSHCTSVALSAATTSPITSGQDVAFAASAKGCAPTEFRFVLTDALGTAGSVVQDWAATSKWTWHTFSAMPGRYVVRVDARPISAGEAPPDASAYLPFTVVAGSTATVPTCKLPISGTQPGSGGFVQMPSGAFTVDPASNVQIPGRADMSGLRRGYTYDPVHGRWLPVPRDWVMPDFSSYVYVGTEYPHSSNQPALHVVNVSTGTDRLWPNGDALYGLPISLRPDGAYGAPGPEIITRVDPQGVPTVVDQGHYGLFSVITSTAIWATRSADPSALSDVQRIDPKTDLATDWFVASGGTAVPIGVDGLGNPIVAVGAMQPSGRMAASQIWIVPQPSTSRVPAGTLIYSDASHPVTIIGWPVVSAGAIWIETDQGLWVAQGSNLQMTLVSSFSGYIAGGCL